MDRWGEMRATLLGLESDSRRPLVGFPDPRSDLPPPLPISVRLEAWASDIAAALHNRFGADIELTVGYLTFPERNLKYPAASGASSAPDLNPAELAASLDRPISVQSGHALLHELRIRNVSARDVSLHNNGCLTAVIIEPSTGAVVGGYSGAQTLALRHVPLAVGRDALLPLLVGTSSLLSRLGYAIPPGVWAFRAMLDLDDGRSFWTSALALTVTA